MSSKKVVLVTGVSSGIGEATARLFATRGYRVYGTVRKQPRPALPGVEYVTMDIRDDRSVLEGVERMLGETGAIHVLVNNAGISFFAAAEETSVDEARTLFETNLFGLMRVTNAVLPSMRRHRSGRIVNISSVLGFLPAPFRAAYSASKHALEGYTESLDHEIRLFGLRAVTVQPAFTRTRLDGNSPAPSAHIADYADAVASMADVVKDHYEQGIAPDVVAHVVLQAAEADNPLPRYPVAEARRLTWLRKLAPPRLFAKSFRKRFRLEPVSSCENRVRTQSA
jgi:NAD(P)-dependent dehydrogenase (short-subunit alcohol dehydrogenase family)